VLKIQENSENKKEIWILLRQPKKQISNLENMGQFKTHK
jgi:hypothetical protein